jgi:hypothetical protein
LIFSKCSRETCWQCSVCHYLSICRHLLAILSLSPRSALASVRPPGFLQRPQVPFIGILRGNFGFRMSKFFATSFAPISAWCRESLAGIISKPLQPATRQACGVGSCRKTNSGVTRVAEKVARPLQIGNC